MQGAFQKTVAALTRLSTQEMEENGVTLENGVGVCCLQPSAGLGIVLRPSNSWEGHAGRLSDCPSSKDWSQAASSCTPQPPNPMTAALQSHQVTGPTRPQCRTVSPQAPPPSTLCGLRPPGWSSGPHSFTLLTSAQSPACSSLC